MGVVKIHLGDDFWDSVDYFARELFCIKGWAIFLKIGQIRDMEKYLVDV